MKKLFLLNIVVKLFMTVLLFEKISLSSLVCVLSLILQVGNKKL